MAAKALSFAAVMSAGASPSRQTAFDTYNENHDDKGQFAEAQASASAYHDSADAAHAARARGDYPASLTHEQDARDHRAAVAQALGEGRDTGSPKVTQFLRANRGRPLLPSEPVSGTSQSSVAGNPGNGYPFRDTRDLGRGRPGASAGFKVTKPLNLGKRSPKQLTNEILTKVAAALETNQSPKALKKEIKRLVKAFTAIPPTLETPEEIATASKTFGANPATAPIVTAKVGGTGHAYGAAAKQATSLSDTAGLVSGANDKNAPGIHAQAADAHTKAAALADAGAKSPTQAKAFHFAAAAHHGDCAAMPVAKYNENHDEKGEFASGPAGHLPIGGTKPEVKHLIPARRDSALGSKYGSKQRVAVSSSDRADALGPRTDRNAQEFDARHEDAAQAHQRARSSTHGATHPSSAREFHSAAATRHLSLAQSLGTGDGARVGKSVTVVKADADQHMMWGWALVSVEKGQPVTDLQGDVVETDELQNAVHGSFMKGGRQGRFMHTKKRIGEVVDSIVFTKDLQKALNIDLGREGWFVGMKITDPTAWKMVKSGALPAFSIGGAGERHPITPVSTMGKALSAFYRRTIGKYNENHDDKGLFSSGEGGAPSAKNASDASDKASLSNAASDHAAAGKTLRAHIAGDPKGDTMYNNALARYHEDAAAKIAAGNATATEPQSAKYASGAAFRSGKASDHLTAAAANQKVADSYATGERTPGKFSSKEASTREFQSAADAHRAIALKGDVKGRANIPASFYRGQMGKRFANSNGEPMLFADVLALAEGTE